MVLSTAAIALISCAGPSPSVDASSGDDARTIDVDGVRIHYFDFNRGATGTPILWIHGYAGTGFEASFIVDALGPAPRLIAPDLPGSGLSDKPPVDYTLDYYVDSVRAFARALDLDEYVLVGHSMGGMIAATIAADDDTAVARLVLIAPYGLPGQAGPFLEVLSHAGPIVDAGMQLYPEPLLGLLLRINVFHDPDRIPDDLVDYYTLSIFHTDHAREALASTTQHTIARSLDPTVLSSISLPTMILWGDQDRVLRPFYGATFQTRIAGSRLELVADAGHVPHVEQPEATARLINDFLQTTW